MIKTGAQIVTECLVEQGVETVFGYPGGSVIFLYDALYQYSDKIHHVLTAHEQGAAHAADGYARTSGKTGVVIATSGPGATNLVTGLATAFMDSIPVVAITANTSSSLLGKDSFQEIDIFGVTMPITKHNFIVKRIEDLAPTIRRAFEIAQSGRQGPVLVDVLKDILTKKFEFEPKKPVAIQPDTSKLADADLAKAAELINASKKPMIYAGGGVISANAAEGLYRFVKKIGAAVTLSFMGLGAYPSDEPEFTGMIGMHGTKISSLAVNQCDLLIVAGARFSDRVICPPSVFGKKAKILHIDVDAAEVNKNVTAYHAVISDIGVALEKLNGMVDKKNSTDWLKQVASWKKQYPRIEGAEGTISPQYLIDCVSSLMKEDDIIVTDVGQHQMWTAQCYPFKKPRTFVSSGGLGTMGFGLGAAIGSQFAKPDKRVVLFTGDGSFHMNLNELVTANMNDLPIVVIIMNNSVLGMVRQWQKIMFDKRYSQTTLNRKTDFIKLSEAFGGKGYRITAKENVLPVLKEAFAQKVPVVVDCVIDKDVNVLPIVPVGGTIDEPVMQIDN